MNRKLFTILALLCLTIGGAWAQTTYKVTVNDGNVDTNNWEVIPAEAKTTGVESGTTVTLKYNGKKKVKSVRAVGRGNTPDEPPSTGIINGKFSVSSTKQVYFAEGNLQATYNGSAWSWTFAKHQWEYIGNAAANTSISGNGTISGTGTVDLFGWVGEHSGFTNAAQYGISKSTKANQYGNTSSEALKSDWGTLIGTGWRTLAGVEWNYLLNTRTTTSGVRYAKATVNGVAGLILLPDDWSTSYYSLNTNNVITSSDWTNSLETHGAVFLPAAGYRNGSEVNEVGSQGAYWSATSNTDPGQAYSLFFENTPNANPSTTGYTRTRGHSVRLVLPVQQ